MAGLTDKQIGVVQTMLDASPDTVVGRLSQALSADLRAAGAMAEIRDLVRAELAQRRLRATVFAPLTPLVGGRRDGQVGFNRAVLAAVWRGLKADSPADIAAAETAANDLRDPDAPDPEVFDLLCLRAAKGLRAGERAFAEAGRLVGEGAALFATCLELTPIARRCVRRLPEWLGRPNDESTAAARLAYADAVAVSPEAGPLLFDVLAAHLDEPWLILRVLSAVMDRPGDRYVSGSEVARFGERILNDIETRLDEVRRFDGSAGPAAAAQVARSVEIAAVEIAEFEHALDLSRDGPWGRRIAQQRHTLATVVEERLRGMEKAVAAALPVQPLRTIGRLQRNVPRLSEPPSAAAVARAEGLLTFLQETRASAGQAGFGTAWLKAAETLEKQIDLYVEDLLETVHGADQDAAGLARLYLDVAIRLTRPVSGDRAAETVRRRAAAA